MSSYLVLARKYRPLNFAEMVGQEHVLKALINALDNQRLHHAYVFAGTRGVGKTTLARIFAKCLNNPEGISATPDLQSNIAKAIDLGQFIDHIEVDAASRTKVEQTRELLENIAYPPSQGRFKTYLIDETHQLSNHSFNTLLKTLEEPPEFVKFLFATTEVHKLPITITSRTLVFNLRQIPQDLIRKQLEYVLGKEQIAFDKEAVKLLAKAGRGSMRDALSITDQAIAHSNGDLKGIELAVFLGMLNLSMLDNLVELVLSNNVGRLMPFLHELARQTPNYDNLIEQLLQLLQQAAIHQFSNNLDTVEPPVKRLAKDLNAETIQLYYQILLRGKTELSLLENQDMGFAMLLLRLLAFTPAQGLTQIHAALAPAATKATTTAKSDQTQIAATPVASKTVKNAVIKDVPTPAKDTSHAPLPTNNEQWISLFKQMEIEGFAYQLIGRASFNSCDDDGNLTLNLAESNHLQMKQEYQDQIINAIKMCVDIPFKISYNKLACEPPDSPLMLRQKEAASNDEELRKQVEEDPDIQRLVKSFDATITNVTTPNSLAQKEE